MQNPEQDDTDRERQLDAIIAEYYRLADAGEIADQSKFIQRHPEFASELKDFFSDARLLHGQDHCNPSESVPGSTIAFGTSHPFNPAGGSVVRYFGEYEILEKLGAGGMGIVYKARQKKLKRIVALKMIRSGELANSSDVQRFEAEAKAAAKLSHPGIVSVHEVGIHHGQHFYAMDYVEGGNLSQLHRDEPVAAKHAVKLVRQLAEAMHYAHLRGIVHRDLKPANILLTAQGEPRITDFGLAKRFREDDESQSPTMTESGQILGTAGYMSPEQASGKSRLVGPTSDVYSLGAVLYALLTSRAPFVGDTPSHTIMQVLQNEPISPRKINPSVSRDLETICLKCLEKEPHKRYGTAQLLAEDLQRFLEGRPVIARPVSRPARAWRWCSRNPVVATLATAMLFTLILSSVVSAVFGIVARNERDAAMTAKGNESIAKQRAQKDRDGAIDARQFAQEKEHEALASLYVSRLYALAPLWQQNEWGELDRLMTEWEPKQGEFDFRGWEWNYLQDQLRQQVQRLPGRVNHAVWSPDGKYLAAAGDTFLLYDAATLKEIKPLGTGGGHFVAWSNDSTHLALLSSDTTRIVHVETGNLVNTIQSSGTAASWSPEHMRLAIVGHHNTATSNLKIWSANGTLVKSIELGEGVHTRSVDWHPKDEKVLVSHEANFSIWDPRTGSPLAHEWSLGHPAWTVQWSPDGTSFLVGGGGRNRVWKMQNGKTSHQNVVTDRGHSDHAVAGCWSPDGNLIASGGKDFLLLVFRADSGQFYAKKSLHSSPISHLSWHPDGRLVSCDEDGASLICRPLVGDDNSVTSDADLSHLSMHNTETANALPKLTRVTYTQWSHRGDRVATFCPDGAVRVWSTKSHDLLATLRISEPSAVESLGVCVWSPDDREIVVANTKRGWLCFCSSTGSLPRLKLTGFSGEHLQMPYWTGDGRGVVACRGDGSVVRLDARTGTEIEKSPGVRELARTGSPDGRHIMRLVSYKSGGIIEVVDTTTMAKRTISIKQGFRDVAWHPDGRQIGVAAQGGIVLIDVVTGKQNEVIKGGLSNFCSLAWSPDGRRLAVGTTAGQIDILDAESHLRLITLKRPESLAADNLAQMTGDDRTDRLQHWITSLDWSLDSRRLVSGGERVLIWGSDAMPSAKTDLRESFQSAIQHTPVDVERLISIAVIQQHGTIEIEDQNVRDAAHLPNGKFRIRSLTLSSFQPINKRLGRFLSRLEPEWRLDASDSGIDGLQLNLLHDANALRELVVRRCQLDDEMVAILGAFKQLKLLDISDSLITADGVAELRRRLPNTEVRWNAREADRAIAQRLLAWNAKVSVMIGRQRVDLISPFDLPEIPFRVVSIKAEEKPGLTVEDFEGLEKLDALESIKLEHTGVNEAVLAKMNGLTDLQLIGFSETTGKPLAAFSTMSRMHAVGFVGGLMDEYLAHFDKFPNLTRAWISWNPMSDTGLANLPPLPELILLVCEHTQIQGSAFPSLNRFQKLRVLNFSDTLVDDEGFQKLPVLPALTELRLANTSLTDASLPHLSRFTTLAHLDLSGTSITPSGLAELRTSLKGCTIEWSPAPVKVPAEPGPPRPWPN